MIYIIIFTIALVPPIWLALQKNIFLIFTSLKASIIPTRYGVTSLDHLPAKLELESSTLYLSAHWLTLSCFCGFSVSLITF